MTGEEMELLEAISPAARREWYADNLPAVDTADCDAEGRAVTLLGGNAPCWMVVTSPSFNPHPVQGAAREVDEEALEARRLAREREVERRRAERWLADDARRAAQAAARAAALEAKAAASMAAQAAYLERKAAESEARARRTAKVRQAVKRTESPPRNPAAPKMGPHERALAGQAGRKRRLEELVATMPAGWMTGQMIADARGMHHDGAWQTIKEAGLEARMWGCLKIYELAAFDAAWAKKKHLKQKRGVAATKPGAVKEATRPWGRLVKRRSA